MMMLLVILGIFSYRRLAIDMYPDVEIPVLSIVTKFPGASPETVEREVTKRIEEVVNRISGTKHVISISRESLSQVVVEFQLEVKINEASQEARAKINTIRGDLPQEIEEPIIRLDFLHANVSVSARKTRRGLDTLVEKKVSGGLKISQRRQGGVDDQ
jgi:HAE1 family hydrophobic/amphiphilic exporter-1